MNTNSVEQILKDNLVSALDTGKETITTIVDKLQTEAPLLVEEFLQWAFYDNLISALFSGTIVLLMIIGSWKSGRFLIQNGLRETVGTFFSVGCLIITLLFFTPVCFVYFVPSAKKAIQVKVAPRIVLVEWVSDQIKK